MPKKPNGKRRQPPGSHRRSMPVCDHSYYRSRRDDKLDQLMRLHVAPLISFPILEAIVRVEKKGRCTGKTINGTSHASGLRAWQGEQCLARGQTYEPLPDTG